MVKLAIVLLFVLVLSFFVGVFPSVALVVLALCLTALHSLDKD